MINCVGIFYFSGKGEISLREVNLFDVILILKMNVIGFLLMVKYFGLNFSKWNRLLNFGKKEVKICVEGGVIIFEIEIMVLDMGMKIVDVVGIFVNMLVRVGLVIDNWFGGWYSYRMFKVVFNMVIKNFSIELGRKNVICVFLYFGIVNIDLFSCYLKNVDLVIVFIFEFFVDCLMNIIYSFELKDNGKFFVWDGKEIRWWLILEILKLKKNNFKWVVNIYFFLF